MKREDVVLLMQLLQTMQELAEKIDSYYKNEDVEKLASAKRELLGLQKKMAEVLR